MEEAALTVGVEVASEVAEEEAALEIVDAVAVVEMASKEVEAVEELASAVELKFSLNPTRDSKESTFSEERMTPFLPRTWLPVNPSITRREYPLM